MFSICRVVVTRILIALNAGRPPPSKEPRRPALVVLGTPQHLLITLLGGVAALFTYCLERDFCELRLLRVLRSSPAPGTAFLEHLGMFVASMGM